MKYVGVTFDRSLEEDEFLHMDNGMFDHNLFGLSWGPAVAALSYIFDKSSDPEVLRRERVAQDST